MSLKKLIAISAIVILAVVFVFALNSQEHKATPAPTVSVSPVANPPTKEELLKLVNEERAKNGVAPLIEDERLDTSAQRKSDDMATYNYFGHISPNDSKHGYEYINDVHINCTTDSENLVGAIDAKEALKWWINSKPHHSAMINPSYTLTGFGIKYVKDIPASNISASDTAKSDLTDSYVITEHFCAQ